MNSGNILSRDSVAAILRIRFFSASGKRFFASSLKYIKDENIPNLILDLRGNTGGNRKAAISLAKHLVDTIFSADLKKQELKVRMKSLQYGRD